MAAPDQRRGRGPRHQLEEHKAAIDSAEVTRSRRGHISIKVDRQVRTGRGSTAKDPLGGSTDKDPLGGSTIRTFRCSTVKDL